MPRAQNLVLALGFALAASLATEAGAAASVEKAP